MMDSSQATATLVKSYVSEDRGDRPPLSQSREIGGAVPIKRPEGAQALNFAKSWSHFVAGGIGGMTAAALTAPLDVLKTRLQSDFYQQQIRQRNVAVQSFSGLTGPFRMMHFHLGETFAILGSVYKQEGPRALFKGLGPNLVGVIPARSINFFTYGNMKQLLSGHFNGGIEADWINFVSAMTAGVVTSTATNPIWLIKTRLQLDKSTAARSGTGRQYRNSFDCLKQVLRNEGIRGMYKGMSASYLGVTESTLHWVLYEQMKASLRRREEELVLSGRPKTTWDKVVDYTGNVVAAGTAKLLAAVPTYPHEVARTRLRQAPMADGRPKYTGLVQCFRTVWIEEGVAGLWGGLTPHLLRTVPSAAIMFGMYEGILLLLNKPEAPKLDDQKAR
ncbi:hypothetical protein MCOR25_006628 [Pyricularia grisea]|uniref:Mitochondrial carrier protein RIM2 n=1 Tax=Pyricularia grisea TaxID=148305 RepID=A0A6P8AY44_PYRGI|nr:hypothetical protein PgNI_10386 [Pyricularia grisea]KAI6360826.1 hypothetical protein MCOR25_006628 [Pyricularia grisea]TLD07206.1 hypothetical protein PgNI_10386 [Pyricularia grisea]